MKLIRAFVVFVTVLLMVLSITGLASANSIILEDDFELENWCEWPEYTVFNKFPMKGANCTWYALGRMMQLGYSKYTLDTMTGDAADWVITAARGSRKNNFRFLRIN